MRKGRPATLTSSLLARKGEAEPARLNDGSVPKDVIALQEELVARVAADISRPKPPVVSTAEPGGAMQAAPAIPSTEEASPMAEPRAETEARIPANAEDDDELRDALGSAPIELPPDAADEPDYDPDEDKAAQKESQVTLNDWTARAQSGDTPFAYERMMDRQEQPERSAFIPVALGITVVAVLATLAIWRLSDHGQVFPQGESEAPSASLPAAAPETTAPEAAATQTAAPEATAPETAAAEPSPPAASIAEAPAPPAKPAAAPAGGGAYAVQVSSTTSQATAEHAWTAIAPKIKAAGLKETHAIDAADLGAKGTRYRVKLTGFETLRAAQKACETLKAHRISCLPMKN
jgi:hypothetical protein